MSGNCKTHHFDFEFILELGYELLSVVRTVEVLTLRVLSRSSVITTDDEVSRSEVLSDDSMPNCLARSSHSHSERQESESSHSLGVGTDDGLVDTDTGEVVDISGLGESYDGVNENVGVLLTSGTNGKFSVSAVHGVSGLESDDTGP